MKILVEFPRNFTPFLILLGQGFDNLTQLLSNCGSDDIVKGWDWCHGGGFVCRGKWAELFNIWLTVAVDVYAD